MLDWVVDFDLEMENILEDMTDAQETSSLIANEELESRESSLVETQAQRYLARYLIYKHAVGKTKCNKYSDLIRKVDGDLTSLTESFIKNKECSGVSATHLNGLVGQMDWFMALFDQYIYREDDGCQKRRFNYLDNLIEVLLFKNVKFLSNSLIADDKITKGQKVKKINPKN